MSKKQAGLFGVIAGGGTPRSESAKSLTQTEARGKLRGAKVKKLPVKKKKKK